MKTVFKNESDHGLVSTIVHDTEGAAYRAFVESEYAGVSRSEVFTGAATLDAAKEWCAREVSAAIDRFQTEKLEACPFCGCESLTVVQWSGDDGEFDAIECDKCLAAAPRSVWNQRSAVQ